MSSSFQCARTTLRITVLTIATGSGRAGTFRKRREVTLHELEPGTEVILESARLFEQPLRLQQMDGRLFVVKESHMLGGIRVYTLEHCESEMGVPYTIMGAWITPTRTIR